MHSRTNTVSVLSAVVVIAFGIFGSSTTYGYEEKSGYTSWGNLNAWDSPLPGSNFQTSHPVYIFDTEIDVPDWYEDPSQILDTSIYSVESVQTMGWSFHVDSVTFDNANFSQLTAGSSPTWLELSTSYAAITLGSDAPTSFTLGGVNSAMYILLDNAPSIDVEGTTSGTQRTLTINASIFGSGFYKTGGGILKLTNADNLYTGGTEIDAGTLAISDDGDLGDTSGTLYLNGGTLRSDATFSLSSSRGVDLTGGGYINTNGYNLTIPGTISGNGSLIKQGSGTLTISGGKSGTGEIEVSGGTLQVSSTFTTGSPSTYSYIGDEGTGTLTQSAGTSTFNSGDVILGYGSSDVGTYNLENSSILVIGSVSSPANLYVGNYGQGTFNQSGTSSNTVYGLLSITNSASAYNLSGGTLITIITDNYGAFTQTGGDNYATYENDGYYGLYNESGASFILSGGYLATYGTYNGGTFTQSGGSENVVVGTLGNDVDATYTLSGTGSTLIAAAVINDGTFTENGGTAEFADLSGDGSISLTGGTLALSGTSTYTGSTAINGGVLAISSDAAISSGMGGITFGGGVLQFNNYTSSLTFDDVANLNLGAATGDASTLSTAISGSYGLTYSGPGMLILTGANTYAGDTTVSAGTLKYNITSGSVSVTDGATVTIASGAAVIADGSVDPFSDTSGDRVNIVNDSTITSGVGGFSVTAGGKSIGTLLGEGDTLVASGASLDVTSFVQNSMKVKGTLTVRAQSTSMPTFSVVNSLCISDGATLNLKDNALIVDYGAGTTVASTIRGYLVSAYDSGAWDNPGLGTTPVTGAALGYADSGSDAIGRDMSGNWLGHSLDTTSIAVVFTWYGDCNLDGVVDGTDLDLMGTGGEDTWYTGDLNYDGVVNADDYSLFFLGDIYQTGSLPTDDGGDGDMMEASSLLAEKEAQFSGESDNEIRSQLERQMGSAAMIAPLPEPALLPITLFLPLLAARRRRG